MPKIITLRKKPERKMAMPSMRYEDITFPCELGELMDYIKKLPREAQITLATNNYNEVYISLRYEDGSLEENQKKLDEKYEKDLKSYEDWKIKNKEDIEFTMERKRKNEEEAKERKKQKKVLQLKRQIAKMEKDNA